MKYPSKYSYGKSVSPAQYIAELVCERIAKKDKKDLHYRFWLSPEWEKQYKGQIAAANKLLRKYDSKIIVSALNSTQGLKIYSLRAPHLGAIIDRYQKIVESENTKLTINVNRSDNIKYKTNKSDHNTNSILSKLKELDNE